MAQAIFPLFFDKNIFLQSHVIKNYFTKALSLASVAFLFFFHKNNLRVKHRFLLVSQINDEDFGKSG